MSIATAQSRIAEKPETRNCSFCQQPMLRRGVEDGQKVYHYECYRKIVDGKIADAIISGQHSRDWQGTTCSRCGNLRPIYHRLIGSIKTICKQCADELEIK